MGSFIQIFNLTRDTIYSIVMKKKTDVKQYRFLDYDFFEVLLLLNEKNLQNVAEMNSSFLFTVDRIRGYICVTSKGGQNFQVKFVAISDLGSKQFFLSFCPALIIMHLVNYITINYS